MVSDIPSGTSRRTCNVSITRSTLSESRATADYCVKTEIDVVVEFVSVVRSIHVSFATPGPRVVSLNWNGAP